MPDLRSLLSRPARELPGRHIIPAAQLLNPPDKANAGQVAQAVPLRGLADTQRRESEPAARWYHWP